MAVIRATRPNFVMFMIKCFGFAVHVTFLNSGYLLIATGSEAFSDTILTCPPSDEVGIEGWNQRVDSYGFVYSNVDKKGVKYTVLVKCVVYYGLTIQSVSGPLLQRFGFHPHICGRLRAQSAGPNILLTPTLSLQINANDYNGGGGGDGSTDFANQFRNFDELVKKLNLEIFSKLEETDPIWVALSRSLPSFPSRPVAARSIFDNPRYPGAFGPTASTRFTVLTSSLLLRFH
ncbi:hypothetical protein MKW94_009729 [Papaver nudicaule]|uniref:PI31 proteasome regulator N-terminal domain-containing protein n=1 Tax=Papaver nudicaule TaxID=74823 RepID=A0AA41S1S5_PAPNU|nr:hypothetical protein [Papaver nudicaule]